MSKTTEMFDFSAILTTNSYSNTPAGLILLIPEDIHELMILYI